jgi:hypothetical protein
VLTGRARGREIIGIIRRKIYGQNHSGPTTMQPRVRQSCGRL